jgi:hypothetical protein
MSLLAAIILVVFGFGLIAFTGTVFVRPTIAERFLALFASSVRTHFGEQMIRLLVGAALVVRSPAMWQAGLFRVIGWAVVVSSIALMCAPWKWHQRFAERVLPPLMRHLKLCALGPLVFGALLIYAIFAGG